MMAEAEVVLGSPFSHGCRDWLGSGAFELRWNRRGRHLAIDAQDHLQFAPFESDERLQTHRLCQRDRNRRPKLVRNNAGEVTAVGNSREALVAPVDVELVQVRAF
jgi:hypothetical protein